MRTQASHPIARQAVAALSRRASLLTLGGAALLASVSNANPSEARKKKGQDCKKKATQRCGSDAAACKALALELCESDPGCVSQLGLCCGECSADGLLTCLLSAQSTMAVARLR